MFLNWFRKYRRPTIPNFKQGQIDFNLQKLHTLPTLPNSSTRAIAMANDPNTSLAEFSGLIKSDGAIAAAALRMANSSMFGSAKPVDDIHLAVLRLGTRTCCDLITTVGMRGLFRSAQKETLQRCEALWRHSFFTACLASQLNFFLRLGFRGEEFSAGLLHDLGRFVITLVIPDAADYADPLDFDEDENRAEKEREIIGTDHEDLGAQYCRLHGLPASIAACNQFHHHPIQSMQEGRQPLNLIALIAAADQIANYVQRTHQIATYSVQTNSGIVVLTRGWNDEAKERLQEAIPGMVKKSLRTTQSILKIQHV